ncbi:hypothetical protein [Bacillus weihaiensis]|uniref:hypothetical protein n=1 Tax=Bacillus weihaiensis TaxID=1547283 RepID=UPI0023550A73|nr:hypothetical protein [Bacillus weihaiensis]
MIRVTLELFRIIAIFLIFGAMLGGILNLLYGSIGVNVDNTNGGWLAGIAIYLFLFVLYRNKLQFSGFYKGENQVKLPRKVSVSLVCCSILILIIAPIFR